MNKERAINILLKFAKDTCEAIDIRKQAGYQEEVSDDLTAAIIFLEQDIKKNKKDAKVEIEGLDLNLLKG